MMLCSDSNPDSDLDAGIGPAFALALVCVGITGEQWFGFGGVKLTDAAGNADVNQILDSMDDRILVQLLMIF